PRLSLDEEKDFPICREIHGCAGVEPAVVSFALLPRKLPDDLRLIGAPLDQNPPLAGDTVESEVSRKRRDEPLSARERDGEQMRAAILDTSEPDFTAIG